MDALGWHDLAKATQGRLIPASAWGRATRIVTDSREIQTGDVFWALRGERCDGHDFVANAIRAGASLIVCHNPPQDGLPVPHLVVDETTRALGRLAQWVRNRHEALIIGVTGSVGKTTTKDLIALALGQQFQGLKSPGNFNNQIGLPKTLLELQSEQEFAVLEMGAARLGDIRELCEIARPEVGVITSIGVAHAASFGGLENIVRGKGELLESLPQTGFAVLPGDDPTTRQMARRACCRTVFVGQAGGNHVQARDIRWHEGRIIFLVDDQPFDVALPSVAHLNNALIAIAVAQEVGVSLDLIAEGLQEFQPSAGRGAIITIGPWRVIDDSYNASPTSVHAAIEQLANLAKTSPRMRRYAFIGDMRELGEFSAASHRELGQATAKASLDGVLAFGMFAREIASGALQGGLRPGQIAAGESLDVLLTVLECWLEPGDVVLVKGSRVMQTERVIAWLKERADLLTSLSTSRCA